MDERPPTTRPRKKRRKRVAKSAAAPGQRPVEPARRGPRPQSVPRGAPEPSYDLLAVLARIGSDLRRRVWPALARRVRESCVLAARGLRWLGGGVWHQREAIGAFSTRVLWWSALALLVLVGRDVLGGAVSAWSGAALTWSLIGLGACALVTLAARPQHLRLAAAVLGVGHGAFALLSYVTTTPPS